MLEILYFIILIINLAIAGLLLFNLKNRPNILFFISSVFISIWMATQYLRLDSNYALFWSRVAIMCSSIYPATILLFILDYPKKIIKLTPKIITIILIPSAISAYFSFTPHYISTILNSKEIITKPGYLYFGIGFIVYSIVVLSLALYGINTYKNQDKKKVQYFFYGLLISLVLGITTNIILPNLGIIEFLHIGPIFVTIFTISNIFSILKNQLFEIHIIVGKYLAHFLSLSLAAIIYFSIYWLTHFILTQNNTVSFLCATCSIFIMLPSYNFIKIKLQSTAEKFFLKGIYDYKKVILNFTKHSSLITKVDDLINYLYKLLTEDVEISPIYIYVPEWFDKFKEISKTLTYYPEETQQLSNNAPQFSIQNIKKIEKSKQTILTRKDFENLNISLEDNCKLILNCFDSENNLICLIVLGNKMIGSSFSNEDLSLLNTLCNQISINLLRIKDLRLASQVEVAQKLQLEILPNINQIPNCETSAFFKASNEIGGDFYDIHKRNDEQWIILGDVAGHGMGSGIVMLMIQSIFSTIIQTTKISDPAKINKIANKILCKHFERLTEPRPISLVTLHTRDGKKFKVHGNHENIYIFNHENKSVKNLDVNDLPLGIGLTEDLHDSCFNSKEFTLNNGDVLLLTTDGLTEAYKNGDLEKEQYNDERIIHLLQKNATKKTEDLKKTIIKSINTFTNKIFQDDVTFIIIKSTESNNFTIHNN